MGNKINAFIYGLAIFVFSACSTINSNLKAGPIENSKFAENVLAHVGDKLVQAPNRVYPFHRVWRAEERLLISEPTIPIYVAPVDISQVITSQGRGVFGPSDEDIAQLAEYLRNRIEQEFRLRSIPVVSERPEFGRIIELALVEISTTDVARNIVGTALSVVVPGGGLVAFRSSGSVAIEGLVIDAASDEPLMLFADRERGKTAPFSLNDFTYYSHARDAIDDWAHQLVESFTKPLGVPIPDSYALTLLPI